MLNDGSEKAYGSVDNQWLFYKPGLVSTQVVLSRSRVAPVKKTRSELLNASLRLNFETTSLVYVTR